jgi:hypothetical protein
MYTSLTDALLYNSAGEHTRQLRQQMQLLKLLHTRQQESHSRSSSECYARSQSLSTYNRACHSCNLICTSCNQPYSRRDE